MLSFLRKKHCEVVIINETTIIVEDEQYHKHRAILALTTIINNQTFIMADISLVSGGAPKNGTLTMLDNKDLSVIAATFSNQAVGANSNAGLATFALDPNDPNTVVGTGLATGSGTIIVTAHADWTDKGDGSAQSQDVSVTKNYTVVVSADGATFDVVF